MCPGRFKKNPDIAGPRILITLLPQADHTDPITSQLERTSTPDTRFFAHLSPLYQGFALFFQLFLCDHQPPVIRLGKPAVCAGRGLAVSGYNLRLVTIRHARDAGWTATVLRVSAFWAVNRCISPPSYSLPAGERFLCSCWTLFFDVRRSDVARETIITGDPHR